MAGCTVSVVPSAVVCCAQPSKQNSSRWQASAYSFTAVFPGFPSHCIQLLSAQSSCVISATLCPVPESQGSSSSSSSCRGSNASEDGGTQPSGGCGSTAVLECLRPAWPSDQPDQALWQAPLQELCKGSGHHTLLSHVFRRHLKPKKQHEVARHALVAALAAKATNALVTADIGGGCGHLSRLMAYGYSMEVVCVDREEEFVRGARKFDAQLEQSIQKLQKRLPPGQSLLLSAGPRHAACVLHPGLRHQQFVQTVVSPLQTSENSSTDASVAQNVAPSSHGGNDLSTFGLTGLHTCGDLAPLMLRLFLDSPQCGYVASVACCYMKLTVASHLDIAAAAAATPVALADAVQQGDKVLNTSTETRQQLGAQCKVNGALKNLPFQHDPDLIRCATDADKLVTKLEKLGRGLFQGLSENRNVETSKNEQFLRIGTDNMNEICRKNTSSDKILLDCFEEKHGSENKISQQSGVLFVNDIHSSQSSECNTEETNSPSHNEHKREITKETIRSAEEEHDRRAEEMHGYPMSQHCSRHPSHELSYAARELACHALEAYAERLTEGADNLKVHCYRAALEQLLVRHYPQHRRAGLRPVKNAHLKPFHEYVLSAVSALDKGQIYLPEEELRSLEAEKMLSRWRQVIVFYSLRLLLAPVIETVVLLDRCFFLYENDVDCVLVPAFDPKLSPRNMVLLAAKKPR